KIASSANCFQFVFIDTCSFNGQVFLCNPAQPCGYYYDKDLTAEDTEIIYAELHRVFSIKDA
ncbi:MAG: hypothetical protein MI922_18985, partial [Bacteroidales bacterium]|nr:hypothetical protein [Bacteroidales bacterium]